MTMFEELFALASGASLALTISADAKAGRMTINVIPRPGKDADDSALTKALTLTATPQEFDEGFIDALKGYRETRQSLADQVEATKEVLEAAKAASVKKATEASTKARPDKPGLPTPKAGATAQPTPPASTTSEAGSDDDADASAGEPRAPAHNAGEVADLFG
ncbi:MAG: PRTRC system protein E [Rubrivivax sp.]|nr:PRTRC system protein E [Burkholderiales bacterium]MCW5633539.1 PRTRC system protein E [Rubrivivax sp.]